METINNVHTHHQPLLLLLLLATINLDASLFLLELVDYLSANMKVMERCIRADESVIEMRTGDDMYRTPLLLAVAHGNLEVIKCLVNLGMTWKSCCYSSLL